VPALAVLVKTYAVPLLWGDEDCYRSALEFQARRFADEIKSLAHRRAAVA
jgi:hypothetical protein